MRQHKMTLPRLQTQCRCCHFFKNNYFIWWFSKGLEIEEGLKKNSENGVLQQPP